MTSGGYSLIDRQADEASSSASCEYVCKTCGETVYTDDPKLHKHWCPLEPGDKFLPGRMRFDRPGVVIGPKGDRSVGNVALAVVFAVATAALLYGIRRHDWGGDDEGET